MSSTINKLHENIIREVRRRLLEESLPRTRKCLDQLTDEEIWLRPNNNSNSVGNLVLHLCGNARQWLIAGLGSEQDQRNRQAEFDEKGPVPREALFTLLDQLDTDLDALLSGLQPEVQNDVFDVQGFEETGFGMLLHVVEHFSYHVGQISYFVKWKKATDLGYYAGLDLDTTN